MKGKIFLLGYILISLISVAFAQPQLLEKEFLSIREKYFIQNDLRLDIAAIQIDKNDTISVKKILLYTSQNKFRIDFSSQIIIYDGKYLYTYTYDDSQLVVENFDTTSTLRLIYDIFTGCYKNFRLLSIEKVKQNKVLNLSYKYGEVYFKSVKVLINEDNDEIQEISYVDIDNIKYIIKIYRTQFTVVPDDFFDTKKFFVKSLVDLRG